MSALALRWISCRGLGAAALMDGHRFIESMGGKLALAAAVSVGSTPASAQNVEYLPMPTTKDEMEQFHSVGQAANQSAACM